MSTSIDLDQEYTETTYGAIWINMRSPQRYQIWRMECVHCKFYVEPSGFRRYDESRPDHPQPYGNFASIAHARKVIREHVKTVHQGQEGRHTGNKPLFVYQVVTRASVFRVPYP